MRSSKNTCLADFFMLLTARIIVSGLTSILTAVGITHLLSFGYSDLESSLPVSSAIICEAFGGVKQWRHSPWVLLLPFLSPARLEGMRAEAFDFLHRLHHRLGSPGFRNRGSLGFVVPPPSIHDAEASRAPCRKSGDYRDSPGKESWN